MRNRWNEELTRRGILQLGVAGAALLACPGPLFRQKAFAQSADPHFLVMMFGDGGWDPTQTVDVHDPNDPTDGIDVDHPLGLPSTIRTVGPITHISNPDRAPVDAFFTAHAGRTALINGINTRSTSHDQSKQLVLTGYLDATKPDFAVMAAAATGADLPLPHLLLSGQSFGGPFAGLSGRLGGQMSQAIAYNRLEDETLAVSALGESYVQQALEWENLIEAGLPAHALTGRVAQFHDANGRADKLGQLATSLQINQGNGTQLATSLASAFRSGLTTSVSLQPSGGFDTHGDNRDQNTAWGNVMTRLKEFIDQLAVEQWPGGGSILDHTTVVYCSEFGRTPELNGDNGKDHHPYTSMVVVGRGVRPGTYGLTDGNQKGVKVDFHSGLPSNTGQLLDVTNMVAGLVTLVGANSSTYLPTVTPFTAMIA